MSNFAKFLNTFSTIHTNYNVDIEPRKVLKQSAYKKVGYLSWIEYIVYNPVSMT